MPRSEPSTKNRPASRQDHKVDGLAAELGKKRPFELPEEELYLNLLRATEQASAPVERLIKAHGLSSAQYNALRILRGHGGGPIPSGLIAEQMVTREPDISRLLTRMEALGSIVRERDADDRRVVRVSLTPQGRRCVDALDRPLADLHREQFAHLSADEIASLNALLTRLRKK